MDLAVFLIIVIVLFGGGIFYGIGQFLSDWHERKLDHERRMARIAAGLPEFEECEENDEL